jgi:hypothetical protein
VDTKFLLLLRIYCVEYFDRNYLWYWVDLGNYLYDIRGNHRKFNEYSDYVFLGDKPREGKEMNLLLSYTYLVHGKARTYWIEFQ